MFIMNSFSHFQALIVKIGIQDFFMEPSIMAVFVTLFVK